MVKITITRMANDVIRRNVRPGATFKSSAIRRNDHH